MGSALIFIAEVLNRPTRKTERAAGYDLKTQQAFDVQPFDWLTINTGVRAMIPHGFYDQICDKSTFASRTGLIVAAGVIDSDYTGELKVLLMNPSPIVKSVPRDAIVAQLVVIPIFRGETYNITPEGAEQWSRPTSRGASGFGLNDTAALPNPPAPRRG
jgi:dUTP pyrophosphatase